MNTPDHSFDVILIGSGMGALSAASLFAQIQKKRVLVLERHFRIGGFTHIFKREGKFEWDVGIHYVGDMQPGSVPRALFDYITRRGVVWNEMPETYDVFVYPGLVFQAKKGREHFKSDLMKLFPEEASSIHRYFDDIKKVQRWAGRYFMSRVLSSKGGLLASLLTGPGSRLALMTTGEYLNRHFRNERIKALLASQWGDYGLPPSLSVFFVHAAIASHYFEGGFYPMGGAKRIAESIVPIVEAAGGACRVNHEVTEIIIRDNRAIGVRVTQKQGRNLIEKEFFADVVISDAGAYNTYTKLIPKSYPIPFRDQLHDFPAGTAHVSLYLGLKDDPKKHGFHGENYWLYASYDHDRTYQDRNELMQGKVGACYVSFPSAKNPEAKGHTMELIAFMDYKPLRAWAEQPWRNRDEEYQKLKDHISDALIEFAEARLGGIRDLIEFRELSTPLSTEHFTGHREGAIYGLPAIPERFRKKWLRVRTPVKNLYLAGADALMLGILPTMMSGVMAYSVSNGLPRHLPKVFKTAIQYGKQRV